MRATRHCYTVDGWGAGEVWVRGRVLIHHELAGTLLDGVHRAEDMPAQDESGAAPAFPPGGATSHVLASARPESAPADSGRAKIPEGVRFAAAALPAHVERQPPNVSRRPNDFVSELCRLFARHLEGASTAYRDVHLDDTWCTPFQLELLHALRAVPWGEVVSYGELAALAGRPGAARAAGTFCAENRFSLVVPCHRVVAADGIGGYGTSGVTLKRRLLALEGVDL